MFLCASFPLISIVLQMYDTGGGKCVHSESHELFKLTVS